MDRHCSAEIYRKDKILRRNSEHSKHDSSKKFFVLAHNFLLLYSQMVPYQKRVFHFCDVKSLKTASIMKPFAKHSCLSLVTAKCPIKFERENARRNPEYEFEISQSEGPLQFSVDSPLTSMILCPPPSRLSYGIMVVSGLDCLIPFHSARKRKGC